MGDTIIDTKAGIRAFAMLQMFYKLRLEVEHPDGPRWRHSPAKQARQILACEGRPTPGRPKRAVLEAFEAWLREEGILS